MKRRALATVIAASLWAVSPSAGSSFAQNAPDLDLPSLIVIVRHADRAASPPDDPSLSEDGKKRAQELGRALKDIKFVAMITSSAKRTQDTKEDLRKAEKLFSIATANAPHFALGYAGLAIALRNYGFQDNASGDAYERALEAAAKAVELDDREARCRTALSYAYIGKEKCNAAVEQAQIAIDLTPSSADAHLALATSFVHLGRVEESIPLFHRTIALSPRDANVPRCHGRLAYAHLCLKQYDEAIQWAEKAIRGGGGWPPRAFMIAALGHLGRIEEAQGAIEEFQTSQPDASVGLRQMSIANTCSKACGRLA